MLAAVVVTIVLATTLLATGPVLAAAVAQGGLRASLEQAAATDIGVEVEARTTASRALDAASALTELLDRRLAGLVDPADVSITAGTVHLVDQPREVVTPVHVRIQQPGAELLVEGGPPVDVVLPPTTDVVARLHVDALAPLGLAVGDVVATDGGTLVGIGGTVAPADVTDRRWWDDPTLRDAVVPGESFDQVGPLYVTSFEDLAALLGDDDPRVVVRVRTLPVLDEVGPEQLGELGGRVRGLEERVDELLASGVADRWTVLTPLATATSTTGFAIAATRASVLAAMGQIAVLALYTLGLAGRLLRSGRDVETMLVRARGATPRQLGGAALTEGVVLVVPAVLVAPFLAAMLTTWLGRLGVVTGAGLTLHGVPSVAALGAAAVAGVACLVVLVVPAVNAARGTYVGTRAARGRRSPIGAAQALGLDLALVAVAAIGIWQLRRAGGPLGSGGGGPDDVDLVLVLAPALGLLAGALLVLRLVPGIARGGETLAERGRGLVAGLSGWQAARRPDAVARPTLLLVLGVAVGVLAATYGATWSTSQDHQADAAVGADLVLEPDRRVTALPDEMLAATVLASDEVVAVAPVFEGPVGLVPGAPVGTLLGIEASAPLLRGRADVGPTVAYEELDVPALAGLPLPAGALLTFEAALADDPRWPGRDAGIVPVVRDGHGLLHRLGARAVPAGEPVELAWEVAALTAPAELIAVEVKVVAGDVGGEGFVPPVTGLPDDPNAPGDLPTPLLRLDLGSPHVDGVEVPLDDVAWITDPVDSRSNRPPAIDSSLVLEDGWELRADAGLAGPQARDALLRIVAATAAEPGEGAVPALVDPGVLETTGREVGDALSLRPGGARVAMVVVGTTDVVPGVVDEPQPVVVDIDALTAARWANGRVTTRPTRWHLALDPAITDPAQRLAVSEELRARLRGAPVGAVEVAAIALDAAGRRQDPIAVGLLVALTLGAVAAVVLALLGTLATAVVGVRERASEFALLQAVGTSIRQLRWWLAGETALVVVTGLSAGAALGAVLVWAVLPTIALASDGTLAVPAPLVVVPWSTLLGATGAVVLAFTAVPVVLARIVARAHIAEVLRIGEDG